jgi:hypothetical protein
VLLRFVHPNIGQRMRQPLSRAANRGVFVASCRTDQSPAHHQFRQHDYLERLDWRRIEETMTKVEMKSRPRFTHGGARPGAGRKRGVPNRWPAALAVEIRRLSEAVEKLRAQRLVEGEHGGRILARLVGIERQLGLRSKVEVPRHTRSRPLGTD